VRQHVQQLDAARLRRPIIPAVFPFQFMEEHCHGEERLGADQECQMAADQSPGLGALPRGNELRELIEAPGASTMRIIDAPLGKNAFVAVQALLYRAGAGLVRPDMQDQLHQTPSARRKPNA